MHVHFSQQLFFPKKRYLLFFLLLPFFNSFSQDNYKDLKIQINQSSTLSEQYDLLDSLERILYHENVDSFLKYGTQSMELAIKMKRYDAAAEKVTALSHKYNMVKTDKESAMKIVNRMLTFEDSLKVTRNKGDLYAKLAGINFNGEDFQKAIAYYDIAIGKYGEKDSLNIADMYLFKGQAYNSTGEFMKALDNLRKSYSIYEAHKDSSYMASTLMEIAGVYGRNGFHEKSLEINLDLDTLCEKLNNPGMTLSVAVNTALKYKELGDENKRFQCLEKSLSVLPKIKSNRSYYQYNLWSSLANYYSDNQKFEAAKSWLDSLETLRSYFLNSNLHHSKYLKAKLNYIESKGELKYAKKDIETYLAIAEDWDQVGSKKEAYQFASKFYASIENHAKANHYLNVYHHLRDSIQQKTNLNQLLFYQTAFETEKKEKELNQEKALNRQLEKDKVNTRNVMALSMAALSFLFGMLYFFRIRSEAIKEKELQEDFAQQLIEHQENEKKRVSESLHDSLGQSLLLIKNKVILNQDKSTQAIVDQAIAEVSSISKALHPLQLEQLGLTQAIQSNIDALDEASEIFFSSELENIDGLFGKNEELNFYRIIQEALSNVVKHSQAKACKIDLRQTRNQIILQVKDNGVGFDFSEEFEKIGSLGLKTLKSRVQQLKGSLIFDSQKGKGTMVKFIFPR